MGLICLGILSFATVEILGLLYYRTQGPFHSNCHGCGDQQVAATHHGQQGWACPKGHYLNMCTITRG
jgi:hypothetical protein